MPEDEWFGIRLNLVNNAATQYTHWNFNSFCDTGQVCLGANSDGIYLLFDDADDDGQQIWSLIEFPMVDLKMARLRSIWFGYEADGELEVTVRADEAVESSYTLPPIKRGLLSQTRRITIERKHRGRYWTIGIQNLVGSDFSLDSVELYPVILPRRSSDNPG